MPEVISNPGSFNDFAAEFAQSAAESDMVRLRNEYARKLAAFRESLAEQQSVSLGELHVGILTDSVEIDPAH